MPDATFEIAGDQSPLPESSKHCLETASNHGLREFNRSFNRTVVVAADEADRVIVEKRLPNERSAIPTILAAHREELATVPVHSISNRYWQVDGLHETEHLGDAAYLTKFAK